jgi:preprotein translocase subunit SecE
VGRIQRKKTGKKKKKPESSAEKSVAAQKTEGAVKAVSVPAAENKTPATKPTAVAIKKTPVLSKPASTGPKDNFITKSIQFLREVKVELKKVTWPSRKQTLGSTVVVLILVTIIAFFLGAVDIGLSSLVKIVLR